MLGAPHELDAIISEFAVHGIGTDRIVIAGEADFLSPAVLREVERICKKRQIELSFLPRMIGATEQIPAATSEPLSRTGAGGAGSYSHPFFRLKRWIDVIGSLALIVLASPVLLIGGVLVLLDVGSPILFWQERAWLERTLFLNLQISNLGSTVRFERQSDAGEQTTFSNWPLLA